MLQVTGVRTELTLQLVTMEGSSIGGSVSMEASLDWDLASWAGHFSM